MRRKLVKTYRFVLILALIPALLILSLRLGLPQVSRFSDQIASHLSQSLGMQVQLGTVKASLDQWRIRVNIQDITLLSQSESEPRLSLKADRLDVTLDLFKSIQHRVPVFSVASLHQADILLQQHQGRWLPAQNTDSVKEARASHYLALLQYQPNILLQDVHLGLQPEEGPMQLISPINALFEASSGEYQISGSLRMPRMGEDAYAVFALHALSIDPEKPLEGHYRFFVQSDALGPELLNLGILPLEMDALNVSSHLWGEWQNGQLTELQGQLAITPLSFSGDRWPEVDQLEMQFALLPLDEQRYQLQLRNMQATTGGVVLSIDELIADVRVDTNNTAAIELLQVTSLDLAALHHWIDQLDILPDSVEEILERLSPEGRVSDLVIYWQNPEDLSDFVLQGRLDHVAVSAWDNAPEASGISGFIHAGPTEGKVILESAAFTLNFPELFGSGWQYSEASGEVSWQVTGEALRLNSGLLSLSNPEIQAKGRFGLYRPFDSAEQIEFSLLIGVTDADALQTEFYTPPKELGETLYNWLKTSIRSGSVNQAGLMIHAGLRPDAYHLPVSVQLFLDAEDAEFAFDPNWPSVQQGRIFLHLRNTELRIDISSGQILNSSINSGWVYLPPKSQQLHVAAMLKGDASDFSILIQESALGDYLGTGFDDWQLEGDTTTRLSLQVPVGGEETLGVQVNSVLQDNRLHLQERDLRFSAMNGRILYSTRDGLRSEDLKGQLFNEALSATLSTQGDSTQIAVKGSVATAHLNQLTGISFGQRLEGKSPVDMTLTLCSQTARCPRIELYSNLQGTAIDLPFDWGKAAHEARPLSIDFFPQQQRLHFSYDELFNGAFDLSVPLRGQLLLGQGSAVIPSGEYLEVSGASPELSVQGRITRDSVNTWQAHLSHLYWQSAKDKDVLKDALKETLIEEQKTSVDVSQFPNVSLQIDALTLNDRLLGAWSLDMRPSGQSVSFEAIRGQLQDFVLVGHAHWQAGDFPKTDVTANVTGTDLAEIFDRWNHGRPIETQSLKASAQLTWQGAPWQWSVASLDGVFQFQADEGRIIESGAGANVLRVFGLLNLNTLSRRLRLDFSDLLQRGLVFDQIKGDYELDKGVARIRQPLQLTGPSANMEITGQVDLNTHQLDKTIRVSVPLGSNLTLGAVLLGAPQVAGALFIFDRIMGDRIEKMTRIAYTLTGDWKDPKLNLLNPVDR